MPHPSVCLPSYLPTSLSTKEKVGQVLAMAQQEKWEAFEEEEESLSLSDLPEVTDEAMDEECKTGEAADDFEFQISVAGGLLSSSVETDMCAADEVFFQGQILPLQPSISPGSGFFATGSRGASRGGAGRKSASSAPPGWGILRLGVAKAPEMKLCDIKSRRSSSGRKSNAEAESAKKAPSGTTKSRCAKSHASSTEPTENAAAARRAWVHLQVLVGCGGADRQVEANNYKEVKGGGGGRDEFERACDRGAGVGYLNGWRFPLQRQQDCRWWWWRRRSYKSGWRVAAF
ncbi:hypothetical protein C4D60_Mb04t13930 [Musa balbisiana]|uniref:Uncharacterized protein n=1 Tax=Musa balbisiana TaxID=52838 RepID=A0A4S8KBV3_MUSBA|nr:hypothetical protein C4D60_Mb04t13930 [Musa balbisiana]